MNLFFTCYFKHLLCLESNKTLTMCMCKALNSPPNLISTGILRPNMTKTSSVLNAIAVAGALPGSTIWTYTSKSVRKQSLLQCQDQIVPPNSFVVQSNAMTQLNPPRQKCSHITSLLKDVLNSNWESIISYFRWRKKNFQLINQFVTINDVLCNPSLTKLKNITAHHTTRAELLSCIILNNWTTWYWTLERIIGYCIELDLQKRLKKI